MNTETIKTNVRARFDHNRNKQVLAEKYESKMIFASQGGMWKAGPQLLATLLACPEEIAVILDEYNTPIQINTQDLYKDVQMHWQEQMNAWHNEFTELSRKR